MKLKVDLCDFFPALSEVAWFTFDVWMWGACVPDDMLVSFKETNS